MHDPGRPVSDAAAIRYTFRFSDGSSESFDLSFNPESWELQPAASGELPDWTALGFHQCPNCPLAVADSPRCPLAVGLVEIVRRFERIVSFDALRVEVVTEDRTISRDTSAQVALSSLMGLIMVTSGCPNTAHFRPMARFHLPFADVEETGLRAAGMYLVAQHMRGRAGQTAHGNLTGLRRIFETMHVVNTAIAQRLRAASRTDSSLNAVVVLDSHAIMLPDTLGDVLDDLRGVFAAYLD